ncbi:MAG: sigma-54-dependent Fis family transcriptional regulator [Deltaproteobacteria bacterium]|nr:sigma-54-dependent Fis family transcriptional regulator [Deltaproteobacteria bacterium]
MSTVLLVDDEFNMLLVLEAMLKKERLDVLTAGDGVEALEILKSGAVDVIVTDLRMPRLDGLGLLARVADEHPAVPVIIITAHGTVSTAVEALKRGAFDYITKPFDQDDLKNVIAKALKTRAFNENELIPAAGEIDRFDIVGSSRDMMRVYELVKKVAPTTTTILVTGETGTGKELIAQAIHRASQQRDNPFIKINCAAIAENLLESELFGFEKGAFTGAVHRKPGRFELAHRGTLFLDEIGELPKDMQAKILRVIQDQEFERVGGLKTIKVDVRLIAATNRDLKEEVKNGAFREDLYYRLNVMPIHLPPLRDRKEDVPLLVDYFLQKFNRKLNRKVVEVDPEATSALLLYNWPGNIRELENLMERLVLLTEGNSLKLSDIPPEMREIADHAAGSETVKSGRPFKEIVKDMTGDIEKDIIGRVLDECGGNVSKAASELGLSRKGLQLKMIKYGLREKSRR